MTGPNIPSEIPVDITFERSLYIGSIFRGILYGVEIFTFFASVYCIFHRPSDFRNRQKFYIVYGAILFALVTIEVSMNVMWGTFMWIDHRNYPGGPLGFDRVSEGAWYNAIDITAHATANTLADGLLLYRCSIIYGSQRRILILPILIYLASSGLVVLMVIEGFLQHQAHVFFLHGKSIRPMVPWVSLSVTLNVIITSMICFRLFRMRALMREVRPEMSKTYLSIATMLIESAAPFTIIGFGLVIVAAQNGPLIDVFCYMWSVFCSLSPQMIILRVAMGRGWVKETVNELESALEFAQPATLKAQSQGACMTICDIACPISGSGTPVDSSDTSTTKDMSRTGVVSPV